MDHLTESQTSISDKQRDIDAELAAQEDQIRALLDKLNIVQGAPPSNPFTSNTIKAYTEVSLKTVNEGEAPISAEDKLRQAAETLLRESREEAGDRKAMDRDDLPR